MEESTDPSLSTATTVPLVPEMPSPNQMPSIPSVPLKVPLVPEGCTQASMVYPKVLKGTVRLERSYAITLLGPSHLITSNS